MSVFWLSASGAQAKYPLILLQRKGYSHFYDLEIDPAC
jgi:hypothetical protein